MWPMSCWLVFGSHVCNQRSYIFHYMKAEKFAFFQIVCYFVIKFRSGCCLKLNSTLDHNRVEYTFCSLIKSYFTTVICAHVSTPLFPSQILSTTIKKWAGKITGYGIQIRQYRSCKEEKGWNREPKINFNWRIAPHPPSPNLGNYLDFYQPCSAWTNVNDNYYTLCKYFDGNQNSKHIQRIKGIYLSLRNFPKEMWLLWYGLGPESL